MHWQFLRQIDGLDATDNLISLKDDMVAFIAGHGMRRVHVYVTEEVPR